jgi:hypothetical protein
MNAFGQWQEEGHTGNFSLCQWKFTGVRGTKIIIPNTA